MYKLTQDSNGKFVFHGAQEGEKLIAGEITFPEGKTDVNNGTAYWVAGKAKAKITLQQINKRTRTVSHVGVVFEPETA